MLDRYSLPEMKQIWSEENKFRTWLDVEIAVAEAWEHFGTAPAGTLEKIREHASFTVERIEEIEQETHHDLIAFVKCITENMGDEQRFVHYGVTSYDIEDTALALRLRASADIIIRDLEALQATVGRLAREHAHTPCIGRTHGVHAEPVTFGFKMCVWYSMLCRDIERVKAAREEINTGKISGAVGIFGNAEPYLEERVCNTLGLRNAPVSTQIIQRDRHAQLLSAFAIAASDCENWATEMRNLQRTEILEVQEMFLPGQRGSSAMPHKRNPWRFETIVGLARVIRANVIPAMESITSWHERDNTNSACERVIFADSCCALDFILTSFNKLMNKLEINKDNMLANLGRMGQLVFSEHVLLCLIRKGLTREEGYKVCQRNAARTWDENVSFREALEQDPVIREKLSREDLDSCFDLEHHYRNVDTILKRLGLDGAEV